MPQQSGPVSGPQVRVGTSVLVIKRNSNPNNPTIIVGKRKGSHGEGTVAPPGGHIDPGESAEKCAIRELAEETNLKLNNVRFFCFTNDYMEDEIYYPIAKHYITIFMVCVQEDDCEPELLEEDKCEGWEEMTWDELKSWAEKDSKVMQEGGKKLFLPLLNLFKQRPGLIPNAEWIKKTPAVTFKDGSDHMI